ncbi:MAG: phosphoenolpyruvate--protein phosphotransferase [Desulfomicrobiaceae bacterium]
MARQVLYGIPVAAGIAVGRAHFLDRDWFARASYHPIAPDAVEKEQERLRQAFAVAAQDLERVLAAVPEDLRDHAAMVEAHLLLVRDRKLQEQALAAIAAQHINAEWALERAVAAVEATFTAIEDEYLRSRMQDVRQAAERVLGVLVGQAGAAPMTQRGVLLARDLSPADLVEIDFAKVLALATASGGKTSHVGILARSLQIPAVVGVEGLDGTLAGELIILDGFHGRVLVDPDEDELARSTELAARFDDYQAVVLRSCHLPAQTRDGFEVQTLANIELFEEVVAVRDLGAEGIGLYRTEYTYMNRETPPSEEELAEQYLDLASIMAPHKVVIRTLDVGADKLTPTLRHRREANPALGLRAIRYCLHHRDVFRAQLRAILRASVVGNVHLLLPMISGIEELVEVKKFYREVQRELAAEGVPFREDMPLGIMMELPSAVMTADVLAQEVDFFSIGTNDLIQYTLGIDRTNKDVSALYQPLHPAIVRSIKWVVDSGHRAGIDVCVCGELAADPFCVPVLLGMRVDAISLNPRSIPSIKRLVRQTTMEECDALLKQVMASQSVARSNRLVREMIYRHVPDELLFSVSLLGEEVGG